MARKRSKKRRTMGRIVVEIRCGIDVERTFEEVVEVMEGMVTVEFKLRKERLASVYINGDLGGKIFRGKIKGNKEMNGGERHGNKNGDREGF